MTPQNRIDTIIDNAASRMTQAKPSDALRANVMSRIAVEKSSRFAWRYVFAGGAIASIALVAFVSFNRAIPNSTISTPTLINPAVINASADPTGAANPSSPLTSVVRTAAAHNSGQLIFTTLTDAEREWQIASVPALERPEPLTAVKPLLEGAPIKAIDIEPIRVTPLTVRAIDDEDNK